MTSPAHEQRAHDHRLRLLGRARDLDRARVDVRVVGEDRLAVADRPAGDAGVERALVLEDELGEPVAGQDRAPDPAPRDRRGRSVSASYETTALRLSAIISSTPLGSSVASRRSLTSSRRRWLSSRWWSSSLLAADLPERLGVDHRLGRVAGEDLERPLVVLGELVEAHLRHDDHAQHARLVGHRHEQHRLRAAVWRRPGGHAGSAPASPSRIVSVVLARPSPSAPRRSGPGGRSRTSVPIPDELAVERDRLAHAGDRVDAVDADRVVADQAVRLGHDRVADPLDVLDPVEARRQLLDRAQPGRALADRRRTAARWRTRSPSGSRTTCTARARPATSRTGVRW